MTLRNDAEMRKELYAAILKLETMEEVEKFFGWQNTMLKIHTYGENPLPVSGGIHGEFVVFGQGVTQQNRVIFPGFIEITDGNFFHGVVFVEFAGEKIRRPVQVIGVVHVAVPVQ